MCYHKISKIENIYCLFKELAQSLRWKGHESTAFCCVGFFNANFELVHACSHDLLSDSL